MADVNQLDVGALVEMGFPRDRVVEAFKATRNQGIPPALEWLFNHPVADTSSGHRLGSSDNNSTKPQSEVASDGHNIEASAEQQTNQVTEGGSKNEETQDTSNENVQQAMSLKCDDCGKLIKSEMDAQSHAARTGHQKFSESTEEIKPLTEEEKIAQRERLQQKLEERRKQRVAEEKQQEREREKTRRRTGKEITQAKEEQAYQEMKRIAEERRKEKMEEKLLKKKLKEQIAKDRAEMKAKSTTSTASADNKQPALTTNSQTTTTAQQSREVTKKEYDTCRLQFRLTDGTVLTGTFDASDTLQNVYSYITEQRTDFSNQQFSLSTTFPRKTFQTSDFNHTLLELKLVPSAVLVMGK